MAAQAAAAQAAAQAAQQVGVNTQQQQQQPGMMGMPPMQVQFKIISWILHTRTNVEKSEECIVLHTLTERKIFVNP
jgi:hypothetical protein